MISFYLIKVAAHCAPMLSAINKSSLDLKRSSLGLSSETFSFVSTGVGLLSWMKSCFGVLPKRATLLAWLTAALTRNCEIWMSLRMVDNFGVRKLAKSSGEKSKLVVEAESHHDGVGEFAADEMEVDGDAGTEKDLPLSVGAPEDTCTE